MWDFRPADRTIGNVGHRDVDVGEEFPMTFRTHEDGRQLVFTGEDDPSPPSYIIKEDDEA